MQPAWAQRHFIAVEPGGQKGAAKKKNANERKQRSTSVKLLQREVVL
jgi:hypothetical protein